jgi:Ca-activated chloride channel family protein
MREPWIICGALLLTLFAHARRSATQTDASGSQSAAPYRLSVSVDEVSLTFHAADAHGLPVNDLKLTELGLLDNGKPPRKILAFQSLQDFPIRAGILMDMSESMAETRSADRAIAIQYAQRLLRRQTDQAFVMNFKVLSKVAQPWSSDATALTEGIRNLTGGAATGSRFDGTAIFDAIYRACLNQFGRIDSAASGNFILLFSDGEDNGSRASLKQAVDMCQHSNTVIYAFRPGSKVGDSTGPKTLVELTSESGGRVFRDNGSEAEIYDDLRTIEADIRNQYRLVYRPPELKHDGSFHSIVLKTPQRVDRIVIRSGYYAPFR